MNSEKLYEKKGRVIYQKKMGVGYITQGGQENLSEEAIFDLRF